MKLGLMLQVGEGALDGGRTARWRDLREMAVTAEAVGFDTVFVPDHLLFRQSPEDNLLKVDIPAGRTRGTWEAWTLLSAMAEATQRVQLGPFVACNSFRNPALLAKMATTLDEVSDGRLVLGIGAGWHEPEYDAFGFPYDHRVARLEEALQILVPLLREGRVDFSGEYYEARECEIAPRGPRPSGPPILIGAQRPRMMRLAATYADIFDTDFHLDVAAVEARFRVAEKACQEVGRDPATLRRAAATTVALCASGSGADRPGVTTMTQEGMVRQVYAGNSNALIDFVRQFCDAGVDLLTLTVIDPPGARGIEQFADLVEAFA